MNKSKTIEGLVQLGLVLSEKGEELESAIDKASYENPWFSKENCSKAIKYWVEQLTQERLDSFSAHYKWRAWNKKVVLVMAGNIPLVGMHDMLVALLCGCRLEIKPSSEDKALMTFVVNQLWAINPEFGERIQFIEKLDGDKDAVIATGSNNSFKYFQYYFKDIPHVLRKNRKSIAILDGNETEEELTRLASDIFEYYGLGCRNVSLIMLPRESKITKVIDAFEHYQHLIHHNKFSNNYTYHKALFLMNNQEHLDNGFVLLKESLDLFAPLGCVFYSYYDQLSEVQEFIENQRENIQCIVGKNNKLCNVEFGHSQSPNLQEFADDINTMAFLSEL